MLSMMELHYGWRNTTLFKVFFFCYTGCGDDMKEKIIMKDIVEMAGFGKTTVSRYFNEDYGKAFGEIDNGFDIYAAQSFLDEKGRIILIGWIRFLMSIIRFQQ